ncbi:hypothetical protein [Roseomonas genomospecies 6]|uniref:DUF2946 domain-containing protein n=1 Tax=Roseomonas genomospecies 6 TaxID=214106 RepID=A0A9W7KNE5_9PROT|nr:hypothetical protein [Roseomonas genomospecies 6]KAA0676179.1 hypothetical protein DS843_28300 [Roseomonas genomospecies 6]
MARGGCTLFGIMPIGRLVAGLLVLAALALFAPTPVQAHVHAGAHQTHAPPAAPAPAPVMSLWVGDADHAPPADDACAGRNGLSCGGACPMMLSGIATAAAFSAPPRASAAFAPTGLLPEGTGPPPAFRPPRMAV